MNMKSDIYKLVNTEGVIIAEGSSKEMKKLKKQNIDSKIWISPSNKIGDVLGNKKDNTK